MGHTAAYRASYYERNRERVLKRERARYAVKRDEIRAVRRKSDRKYDLKKHYGMTVAEWDALFAAQDHRCKSCGSPTPGGKSKWCTDHDHETGQVRGIICRDCNRIAGSNKDHLLRLRQVTQFLEKFYG